HDALPIWLRSFATPSLNSVTRATRSLRDPTPTILNSAIARAQALSEKRTLCTHGRERALTVTNKEVGTHVATCVPTSLFVTVRARSRPCVQSVRFSDSACALAIAEFKIVGVGSRRERVARVTEFREGVANDRNQIGRASW